MGYFSELDLVRKGEYSDRSYHGFEEQLLWRYYLYIDDAFGQGENHFSYASSELYIDLKKENI